MNEKKAPSSSKRSKTFKWVLIILGLVATIALVHLFIFVILPFVMEMHGF